MKNFSTADTRPSSELAQASHLLEKRTDGGVSCEVRVQNQFGLHARPAAHLVKLAQQYTAKIRLKTTNGEADAKSILDILSLAAGPGVEMRVHACGPDEHEALKAVAGFFEQHK